MFKRTKIVCTIGPASKSRKTLRAMIASGMNVARLNFSHGTLQDHAALITNIRAAAKAEHEPVAIMQDLQGPKIRLGNLPARGVQLDAKQRVAFKTDRHCFVSGAVPVIPVTYANLHKDVKIGHRILVDDGLVELRVTGICGREILSRVIHGGTVSSHKGMNFPDSTLSVSAITDKDRKDIAFGVKHGVDFVALSFVTSGREITRARQWMRRASIASKASTVLPRLIAKIEKREAITRFDEILAAADGIMVARGDLGIEIPVEEVPIRQKEIIEKCRRAGKPVVVATQMLDSMTREPRPTRAEVSDVANAVVDHADAVMLSAESATGLYPVKTVDMMAKIIARTEASAYDDLPMDADEEGGVEVLLSHALQQLAAQGLIHGVLCATFLAPWCEQLNRSRPETPLFFASNDQMRVRQMNILWGAYPFFLPRNPRSHFVHHALRELAKCGKIKRGMYLAVVQADGHGSGFELVRVTQRTMDAKRPLKN
jgi:pyruvate kinase